MYVHSTRCPHKLKIRITLGPSKTHENSPQKPQTKTSGIHYIIYIYIKGLGKIAHTITILQEHT